MLIELCAVLIPHTKCPEYVKYVSRETKAVPVTVFIYFSSRGQKVRKQKLSLPINLNPCLIH